jgi:hypothetical protein
VGLIARALEFEGIATTLTSWNAGRTRLTMPPRATFTKLARGATIGQPHDIEQQMRVLRATLDLLNHDAPIKPILMNESVDE